MALPAVIVDAGSVAVNRFLELFAAQVANEPTRPAYARVAGRFLSWCAARGLGLRAIAPLHVAAYIKRRALAAGLPASTCCRTFRTTGITAYLSNGGTLEHAQQFAGHALPRTTKLYDRTADTVTLDEIGRIVT